MRPTDLRSDLQGRQLAERGRGIVRHERLNDLGIARPDIIDGVQLRPEYPLLTPRLRLRPLTATDVDALLGYRGQADVCRYLPFTPMTRAQVLERIERDFSRTAITGEGQALTLGAEESSTGRLVGDVVLFFHSQVHAGGELGYVFHPDVAGRGYATEASAAVLALGFDMLGLHRIVARLDARNHDSARLATRLGMRQEAHLRQDEMFKGEWSDTLIFAMLAAEWPTSPAGTAARAR